jgi:hypothetical protein
MVGSSLILYVQLIEHFIIVNMLQLMIIGLFVLLSCHPGIQNNIFFSVIVMKAKAPDVGREIHQQGRAISNHFSSRSLIIRSAI